MIRIGFLFVLAAVGCSISSIGTKAVKDAVISNAHSYASDNDPELIWEAAPFGLKTIEGLILDNPRDTELLLAAAKGFTQYAYGALQMEADFIQDIDYTEAARMRERAGGLYIRARNYGLRALRVEFPVFASDPGRDIHEEMKPMKKGHVPLLYWTALAWGGAMSLSISNADLAADQFRIEAMMKRALELDESFDRGGIHDFLVSYECARHLVGGSLDRARRHYERSVFLAGGKRGMPHLIYAESCSLFRQDRGEFTDLLQQAIAIDENAVPELRLENILARQRARWLFGQTDELFLN